jgi:hypothetical protein
MRRVFLILPAALLTACLNVEEPPTSQTASLPLTVGTLAVGTLDITANDGAGIPSDRIGYRNTTTRTFSRLGIAIAPGGGNTTSNCNAPFPIYRDTELVGVPPTAMRQIAVGVIPRSLQVFITAADTGTVRLVPAVGGRWAMSIRSFRTIRDTVRSFDDAFDAVTNESGQLLGSRNGVDSSVVTGRLVLGSASQLRVYPGRCAGEWIANTQTTTTVRLGDTITVRGRAEQALTAEESAPDSFQLRMVRRPPLP